MWRSGCKVTLDTRQSKSNRSKSKVHSQRTLQSFKVSVFSLFVILLTEFDPNNTVTLKAPVHMTEQFY